jgi:hypothetical protein
MSRRTLARVAVPALAVSVAAAAVVPALAAGPSRATLEMIDRSSFKPNRYIKDGVRFGRDVTSIRPGGKLAIVDKTRQPHTFSVVKRTQLPQNLRQMGACFSPNGICSRLAVAHGAVDPNTGEEIDPPTTPLLNVGAKGFNAPGDSVILEPGKRTTLNITAKAGKDLYFLCAIHPWMQAKLDVG